MTRKATDVLIELEQAVNKLLALSSNQDLLLKNINNRISSLEKTLQKSTQIVKSTEVVKPAEVVPPKRTMPGLKPGISIDSLQQQAQQAQPIQTIEDEDDIEIDHKPSGQRRINRYSAGEKNKTVPVQQRVLYQDGKNVCLANVEIFQDDKLVKSLKTNASGKWTYALNPGKYTVAVGKRATSNKSEVDMKFDIEITPADKLELDPIQVKES